jgi:AcrR family transcriptional regulator
MKAAPATADPAAARRRLGRAERREAILVAATRAFATGGFGGTSIADISAAAGVSHLIIYRHFDSKEALYGEVLERAIERLTARVRAPGAVDRLGPTVDALLALARADEPGFRVLWRYAAREPEVAGYVDAARDALHASARTALAPIVASEMLDWAARAQVAYLLEAVLQWIEHGDPRLDARFAAATRAALRGGARSWSA